MDGLSLRGEKKILHLARLSILLLMQLPALNNYFEHEIISQSLILWLSYLAGLAHFAHKSLPPRLVSASLVA